MTAMRKRICIISFSPIRGDGRVLREIEYLSPHFDLGVVGYGDPDPGWQQVEWMGIDRRASRLDNLLTILLLILGRLLPALYEYRYWQRRHYAQALEQVQQQEWDAFYANEWAAVPIAVRAAQKNGAPVVYDAHEFSPLERIDEPLWRLFFAPMVVCTLKRYTPFISAAITVCQPIAERYEQEFGFKPLIVLNTPRYTNPPDHETDPSHIRLVHHGSAQSNRHLEMLIEAMPLIDRRYDLTLMLTPTEPWYLERLKQMAFQVARDRVHVIDPVPPNQIVETLAQFDVELALMYPNSFNTVMALPNKFFEGINAGLAVVIGPSPAMQAIVDEYGVGCTAACFKPADIARTINALTPDEIARMKAASRQAARVLNADAQMEKVMALYCRLLDAH